MATNDLGQSSRLQLVQSKGSDYSTRGPLHGDGEPPDNGPMEARVQKLEDFALETRDRLARIETKLDTTATKGDVAEAKSDVIKWTVGTAVGLGVAAITVMTFVLNYAVPKPAAAPASPPPIIINIPGPTAGK